MTGSRTGIAARREKNCRLLAGFVRYMAGNREVRTIAVNGLILEIQISLRVSCVRLCFMCPKMRNFVCREDVPLTFLLFLRDLL